jgi:hypothetical protein
MKSSPESASPVEGLIEEGEAFRRLSAGAARTTRSNPAAQGRRFHTWISVAFLVTAFAAFAPSYYLKSITHAPALRPLLHLHGAVFSAWLVLLFAQSTLVAAHRVDVHRRLGVAGALLAALMVPLGMTTAVDAARHGASKDGLDPLVFLIFPFGQMILFGVFVGAALWNRARPEFHRRFILVATACLMTPAIARFPVIGEHPILCLVLSALFVVAGILHDWRSNHRVHRAYVMGCLALLVSGPLRFAAGHGAAWHSFARFLVD